MKKLLLSALLLCFITGLSFSVNLVPGSEYIYMRWAEKSAWVIQGYRKMGYIDDKTFFNSAALGDLKKQRFLFIQVDRFPGFHINPGSCKSV